jgi:cell wall-associated NlpC family hydrolase
MTRDQAEAYLWILMAQTRRYHWGGDDPIQGFDCSGLAHEWLEGTGAIPYDPVKRSAQQLFDRLKPLGLLTGLEASDPFGALAFFGSGAAAIEHIAICISPTHMVGMEGGDSSTVSEASAIAHNAFAKLRPIAYRRALVGFLRPKYPWD